ncbi:MAG: hypothetical protein E7055_10375 [Lentisphaerae bacterium]|nr:hypothetical protein [Lentisphaerota bacterium]
MTAFNYVTSMGKYIGVSLLLLPMVFCGAVEGIYSPASIKVDGRLREPVWTKAPVIRGFVRPDGKELERKTEVQIVFTPQAVVFGFRVFIPKKELKIVKTPRDKSTTSTDCVEVMIDTAGAGDNYKHIIVNAGNGIYDRYCEQGGYVGDDKWDGEISSAVTVENDCWCCELAIPYRTLGLQANDGRTWKINIARESFGSPSSPREISSICGGAFNTASLFVPLAVPSEVDLEPYKLDVPSLSTAGRIDGGRMNLAVTADIGNLVPLDRDLTAEILIPQPGGEPVRAADRIKLAPGGKNRLSVNNIILGKPGIYQALLTLRDRATNRILLRKEFQVDARYMPIALRMIAPHYRNSIFATQKLKEVCFTAKFDFAGKRPPAKVRGGIRKDGKILVSQTAVPDASGQAGFVFPVEGLPHGKLEIFAAAGEDEAAMTLRNLPYKQGEVWRGTDGNWYKDGKKLFILAGWNSSPYNRYYNIVTRDPRKDEDFFFYNVNTYLGIGKIRKDIVDGKLTDAVKRFYRRKIEMYKDHPRLFGHFLCDEPDIAGYSHDGFRKVLDYLLELDPYHPFMISPGGGVLDFADCAEISGYHAYPKVAVDRQMANFDKIVHNMDRCMTYFRRTGTAPTITYLHQGFDYSDWGQTDTRVPSYEEFRNQNLLSLILGGRGLMHYNRGEDNYPELSIGIPHLTHEQKVIGNEAIIEADAAEPVKVLAGNLRTLAKHNAAGEYWVLVCNTSFQPVEGSFHFPPFGSGKIRVLSENRSAAASEGVIKDHFKPYEVHVYTTSTRDFQLRSIEEINREIRSAYLARRQANAGNLFYQERDNETVRVTASSNKYPIFRAENSLWHLADGLAGDPAKPAAGPGRKGIIVWQDNTPNQVPDCATVTTFKPVTIGRVEVYPAQDSLKDYVIELLVDGKFEVVAEVKDAKGAMQSVSFAPRRTTALRLTVNANRGAYTKVFEIKAFEK